MSYFDSGKIKFFKGKKVRDLTTAEFEQILLQGEGLTVEFKTWIHAKDMRERISLVVHELVMFTF